MISVVGAASGPVGRNLFLLEGGSIKGFIAVGLSDFDSFKLCCYCYSLLISRFFVGKNMTEGMIALRFYKSCWIGRVVCFRVRFLLVVPFSFSLSVSKGDFVPLVT